MQDTVTLIPHALVIQVNVNVINTIRDAQVNVIRTLAVIVILVFVVVIIMMLGVQKNAILMQHALVMPVNVVAMAIQHAHVIMLVTVIRIKHVLVIQVNVIVMDITRGAPENVIRIKHVPVILVFVIVIIMTQVLKDVTKIIHVKDKHSAHAMVTYPAPVMGEDIVILTKHV